MRSQAIIATESQLGRQRSNGGPTPSRPARSSLALEISRPSLELQLSERRVRMTSQRQILVRIIQDSPRHLDAAGLLHIARQQDPSIDRATVYRTIGLLKRHGLIDELDLMHIEGEKHYYEAKTNRDHCHMACFRCGAIMEFASSSFDRLKKEMASRSGFQIRAVRLEVGGVCKQCQKAD
jgi:Fur family transcriptional regulator, ferric uptake regulator